MNAYTVFNEAIYRKAADVIYLPEMNPDYPCFSSPRVTYAQSFIGRQWPGKEVMQCSVSRWFC